MHDPFAPHLWPNVTHRPPAPDFSDPGFRVERVSFNAGPPSVGGCVTCGTLTVAPSAPYRLARPENVQILGSVEVWTLRYGNPPYLKELGATLNQWCERQGYALRVHDGSGYEIPQFSKIDMLRQFLAGSADWFFYVDSDCYLHPDAPSIFEAVTAPGLWALVDLEKTARKWYAWDRFPDWKYRNTGVFAIDRATAEKLLPFMVPPFTKGYLEQHRMGEMFAESGVTMRDLPDRWNSFRDPVAPAWLFHLAGHRKDARLLKIREAGRLPDPVKRHVCTIPIRDFGAGCVVWPYLSTAAEWDELRYSKRSVEKFWSEKDWVHLLIGDRKPDWWNGEFIEASRYEDALWLGVNSAERVLWMNDDIILTAPQSPETLRHARELGDMTPRLGQTLVAQNTWRRGLGQVLMRLLHHGKPVRNFSGHVPYLWEREKALEVIREFGLWHKFPMETAYHNWHRTPWKACTEKAKGPHDLAGKYWINPSMKQVTEKFITDLEILLAD